MDDIRTFIIISGHTLRHTSSVLTKVLDILVLSSWQQRPDHDRPLYTAHQRAQSTCNFYSTQSLKHETNLGSIWKTPTKAPHV